MRMIELTQTFPRPKIEVDAIPAAVRDELERRFGGIDFTGKSVALLLSSRGIDNYAVIVRAAGDFFVSRGAAVRGVPAMGSHAGATPEGQLGILKKCGITPESMGFPLYGEMDTANVGTIYGSTPVFVARRALEAHFILAINRIKPHTQICGEALGSGCSKMYAIGIGKLDGPTGYHALVTEERTLGEVVRTAAALVLTSPKMLGGLGIVENSYHETALLGALSRERLFEEEAVLFARACELMPTLPLMQIGVLLINRIGKMISGSGMDPNVTGRWWFNRPIRPGDPDCKHIAVMSRKGDNFLGVGFGDSCNSRVFAGVDAAESVLNARTGGRPELAVPPKVQTECDRDLVDSALASAGTAYPLVYIRDTLSCDRMWVSEHGARVIRDGAAVTWGDAVELQFDASGNISAPMFPADDH